jgi:hypothetical protein
MRVANASCGVVPGSIWWCVLSPQHHSSWRASIAHANPPPALTTRNAGSHTSPSFTQ